MDTLKIVEAPPLHTRHGMTSTPVWRAWESMRRRCSDPKVRCYKDYGGRGITVCPEWQNSFVQFYADMGPKPTPEHSLHRINNDGNYEPGNCKWGSLDEQNNNRRSNRLIKYKGVEKSVSQWAFEMHIPYVTLLKRFDAKWPASRALTEPVEKRVWREKNRLRGFRHKP